jgi:hypothetical protein
MKTLALVLFGLVATSLAQAESYPASEKFVQTYPVSAQSELSLGNINGSIEIIAWDKNEISLEAEKRASDTEDLAKISIKVDATRDRVVVKTEHERTGWFGSQVKGVVRYKLHVPASINLRKIDSVNSNITISEVRGEVIASTVNGSIKIEEVAGSATLNTVNGNITAEVALTNEERTISANTVNGSCKFAVPSTIAASFRASTVNGHVDSSLPLANLKASRNKLEGRMGQGLEATIEASTVNGNIAFNSE